MEGKKRSVFILAEQALTDEIDRFKRMTLASPDAVYLHDVTSHEITFLNRSLHDVLGLGSQTPATIGAAVFHDVIASDDVESYQAHMAKMRATADGKVEDIMFRVSRRGRPADVWVHTRSVVFTRHEAFAVEHQGVLSLFVPTVSVFVRVAFQFRRNVGRRADTDREEPPL